MPRRPSRLVSSLTVGGFAAGIAFPLAIWAIRGLPQTKKLAEERLSAPLPEVPRTLVALAAWPREFEAWFGDALGARSTLLGLRSFEHVVCLGTSPSPVGYIGRERWVFLSAGNEFEMQRGASPFGVFELDVWVSAIRARQRFCREHGADYLFAIVPDKTALYPEKHPIAFEPFGPSRTDQLAAAFAGDPVFLDLRPPLRAAKAEDRPRDHAYFPLGTHWTDRGAAAGVAAIGERVRALPQRAPWAPLAPADLVYEEHGVPGDSWAWRLYLPNVLVQSERAVRTIHGPSMQLDYSLGSGDGFTVGFTSDDPSLPSAVLFHDSFGQSALRFVARCTSRGLAVWNYFRPELVVEQKPDVVVEMFVERVLNRPPVENLPDQEGALRRLFEAAPRGLFTLVPARDLAAFSSLGGVAAHQDGQAIVVRWTERTAVATLPREALPDSAHVVVRLDLEVPEAVQANFHYKTREDPTYTRANCITKELVAGRNEVFLHLAAPDLRGPIAFRLNRDVALTIHSAETRALAAALR